MASSFDLHNNVKIIIAMDQQTISTDTTTYGADIDTTGYESLEFVVISGTITDGAYEVNLAAGSAATPTVSTAADQLGSPDFALADDDEAHSVGYVGKEKIVRLQIISTATSSGGVFGGGIAILSNPHHAPVS